MGDLGHAGDCRACPCAQDSEGEDMKNTFARAGTCTGCGEHKTCSSTVPGEARTAWWWGENKLHLYREFQSTAPQCILPQGSQRHSAYCTPYLQAEVSGHYHWYTGGPWRGSRESVKEGDVGRDFARRVGGTQRGGHESDFEVNLRDWGS